MSVRTVWPTLDFHHRETHSTPFQQPRKPTEAIFLFFCYGLCVSNRQGLHYGKCPWRELDSHAKAREEGRPFKSSPSSCCFPRKSLVNAGPVGDGKAALRVLRGVAISYVTRVPPRRCPAFRRSLCNQPLIPRLQFTCLVPRPSLIPQNLWILFIDVQTKSQRQVIPLKKWGMLSGLWQVLHNSGLKKQTQNVVHCGSRSQQVWPHPPEKTKMSVSLHYCGCCVIREDNS